jgi:hypothetical protein
MPKAKAIGAPTTAEQKAQSQASQHSVLSDD